MARIVSMPTQGASSTGATAVDSVFTCVCAYVCPYQDPDSTHGICVLVCGLEQQGAECVVMRACAYVFHCRAVDRSTSIPSHSGDRPTYASTVSERATTKGTTFSPGETMSVDAGMAAASASGTQGKGAPVSPRGTIGATHRLAVAATHAAQPHGEAQSAVVRALKAEQQEAAAAAAAGAARSQLPPAHPSGSRSAGDAAPAPARNASENGAATAAARKPRVVAKRPDSNVPRKTSSQSNEGAAQVPGAASAPAAAAGEDAAGDSGKQRSSDQTRSVSVDEPTPTGYRTF